MPNFVAYFYIIGRKNLKSLTKSDTDGILHVVKTIFKTLYGDAGKIYKLRFFAVLCASVKPLVFLGLACII